MKKLKIGRQSDNDIVISDNSVSRYHAELFIDASNYFITDLSSTNGTFVNGNRIEGSAKLEHNDILKVGTSLVPWKHYIHENKRIAHEPVNKNFTTPNSQNISIKNEVNFDSKKQTIFAILSGIIVFIFVIPLFSWSYMNGREKDSPLSGLSFLSELLNLDMSRVDNLCISLRYYSMVFSLLAIGISSTIALLLNLNIWKNISKEILSNTILLLFISNLALIFLDIIWLTQINSSAIDNEFIFEFITHGSGAWLSFICSSVLFLASRNNLMDNTLPQKNVLKQIAFWMPTIMILCFVSNSNGWLNMENKKLDPSGYQIMFGLFILKISESRNLELITPALLGLTFYFVLLIYIFFTYDLKNDFKYYASIITLILSLCAFVLYKNSEINTKDTHLGAGYFFSIIANIILIIDLYTIRNKNKR